MKTERDTTHDYERMAHAYEWSIVLAYSKIRNRLGRPFPVALLRRLLDTYIQFTHEGLVVVENGQRINYDPGGGFLRARPGAIALRASLEDWDGSLPVPCDAVRAAQEMMVARDHREAGRWDEYTGPDDLSENLLWPD